MKNIKICLLFVLMSLSLASCGLFDNNTQTTTHTYTQATYNQSTTEYSLPDSDNPNGYQITFDLGDGETYQTTSTKAGYVIKPQDPERNFATFLGWYLNDTLYDFNNKVSSNLIIKAKWDYDVTSLVNYVYRNTIKACIKVETIATKGSFISRASSDSIGSGVIIDDDSDYYYALTNNHVVYWDKSEYNSATYQVYDAYGNTYTRNVRLLYNNANYDLALIAFPKGDKVLSIVDFAKTSVTTNVFTLGHPKSLSNAISLGYYLGTKTFTPKQESIAKSNVTFEVAAHSAFIDNGSSGGGLFNYNLQLVGINFASSVSETTDEFIRGYAIPIEKVNEFIELYNNL